MDINGGQIIQSNGNPVWPTTTLTGPLVAGNVMHGDGSGNLAGLGGSNGMANAGYAIMAQTGRVTQATNGGSAGVFTSPDLIIPAQSQILRLGLAVVTDWDGAAATLGIGIPGTAAFFTAAAAINGGAIGPVSLIGPGTDATRNANWLNVGNQDVQIMLTSTNTGNGVGFLTVEYIQGINNATS